MPHQGDDHEEKRDLRKKLLQGEGTLEETEQWLDRLMELDQDFLDPDQMLSLERGVKARRIARELADKMGSKLSKEQLIALVEQIKAGGDTEEEQEALLMVLQQNVSDPNVSDYVYWSHLYGLGDDPTAEEIVERALAYKPNIINLGPATGQ